MDMGIVNAGQLVVYEEIEPELLEHVEDVLFNRRPDATERLVELAETVKGERQEEASATWRGATTPVEERLGARAGHGHRRLHRGRTSRRRGRSTHARSTSSRGR